LLSGRLNSLEPLPPASCVHLLKSLKIIDDVTS